MGDKRPKADEEITMTFGNLHYLLREVAVTSARDGYHELADVISQQSKGNEYSMNSAARDFAEDPENKQHRQADYHAAKRTNQTLEFVRKSAGDLLVHRSDEVVNKLVDNALRSRKILPPEEDKS